MLAITRGVEILEMNLDEEAEEDGANTDLDLQTKGKRVVLKTSTRQTVFSPKVVLVDPDKLKPGDLVGVNRDSYHIVDTLPSEYDSRVTAMVVDEKPTVHFNDIGGLEKQIQELLEAIVLPMTHKERFQKLGVHTLKGVLLYGPPGTGKTLMASACAAQKNATFLKLAGPQLVQIHSRKMNVNPDVNFEELSRSTDDFNRAQLKAVCVEAGMLALRRDATEVNHADFNEEIMQVQGKKKASLNYYAYIVSKFYG